MDDEALPTWHQALVYAVTGERRADLGRQAAPDLTTVEAAVTGRARTHVAVPADLMDGIGPARFAAVLTDLRRRLRAREQQPVLSERTPDADERRLLADVPPHH